MKITPARIKIGAAGLFLMACVACPGSLDDPSRFFDDAGEAGGTNPGDDGATTNDASACPDIPTQVFVPTCTTMGCHSAADMIQGLDLQSPGVAARLVGTCARGGSGYLVDPNNPAASVVYTKLTSAPPFGLRMPFGGKPLDAPTIACVLAWVSMQQGNASGCGNDSGTVSGNDSGTTSGNDSGTAFDAPTESASRDAPTESASRDAATESAPRDARGN